MFQDESFIKKIHAQLAFLKVKAPTIMIYLDYFQQRMPHITQAHVKMERLLHYLYANTNLEEADLEFCFEGDYNFTCFERKELKHLFSSAFTNAHSKLCKYFKHGAQPASKFLDQIRILEPRNLIDMDSDFDSIDSIPGIELVSKEEGELYVNRLGPLAVKHSKDGKVDLALFWKSNASELPELYKLASCYCTSTIGSYDVERSFSAYSEILDEKRRSLDESTIKAFHFLNWNLGIQSSIEQEKEDQIKQSTNFEATNRKVKKKQPVPGEASEFPRLSKLAKERQQQPIPAPPTEATNIFTAKKKKKRDLPGPDHSLSVPKKKKGSDAPGKMARTTIDKLLHTLKEDEAHDPPEQNVDTENQLLTKTLQSEPGIKVHFGLQQNTSRKLNMEAACVFPKQRELLLNCLLNGSVNFKGSRVIDQKDLRGLYGCTVRNEDSYINNFVIETYLDLIASTANSKGMKVEVLGWELFEKGFSKRPAEVLLQGKAPLMEQDVILVPCNVGQSKHWFLLVTLPKVKQIIILDSMQAPSTKPSTHYAVKKMWMLLQQVDSHVHAKDRNASTNTPEDVPQQPNSVDCGVFLCFFARSLILESPVPDNNSIHNFRHHMILELHEGELRSFTQPSVQENQYYAIEYHKAYYIGRAMGRSDESFINFKFLHSTVKSGEKVFTWPRCDDIDRVHSSCVFYGPLVVRGVSPLTFPQLSELEQVFQWLRKTRKEADTI